jgi:hypothetical protein
MGRSLVVRVSTVLLVLVGSLFISAPGASADHWVVVPGDPQPAVMTAANVVSGECTENSYVRACFKTKAEPEVFFAKDLAKDGASAGIYVVVDTGRKFSCYHSFGVGGIGKCSTNIGKGNFVCIYTLKWDRSIGDVPVYDRNSERCFQA